jgi:hypothetical protein
MLEHEEEQLSSTVEGVRTLTSAQTRVFPDENERVINDAARAWGSQGESMVASNTSRSAQVKDTLWGHVVDNGLLPFDMDVPFPYVTADGTAEIHTGSVNDVVLPTAPPFGIDAGKDIDLTVTDARDSAVPMHIETDRIPCPRLCGATFGHGIGGLAVFHNGDAKKMWSWYHRTDPTRLSSGKGLIGSPSPVGAAASRNPTTHDDRTSIPEVVSHIDFPRTVQDLFNMTGSARQVQWGEQDESETSSTSFHASADNYFEDDSDGSSESAGDGSGDLLGGSDVKSPMYVSYVQTPVAEPRPGNRDDLDLPEKKGSDRRVHNQTVGPSSAILSPLVWFTFSYDRLSMNNQNVNLALGWKLGEWDVYASNDRSKVNLNPMLEQSFRDIREDSGDGISKPPVSPPGRGTQ